MIFGFKNSRRRIGYLAIGVFASTLMFVACNKNDDAIDITTGEKYFVKVVSVDFDGHEDTSSVVKVVEE